ncbi:hypothetical protein F511_30341 [Dorcoceras hygrometricum]|uniref:Uncharacterized protein n=1 Tax=Dorcoceras hygrometricum TaxID=472368 RepID=A0A2Z7DDN4_9LAMI|nr:hypothetical protein F511_30341 [Dorcoceras hygrometricum]
MTSARPPRNKMRNRRRNNCVGRWLSIGQRCAQRLARRIVPTAQSRATSALDFVGSGRPASGRRAVIACDNARPRPRPETRFLRQPALEELMRSTRMDSPRRIGRNEFPAKRATAAHGGGLWRVEANARFRVEL